MPLIGAHDGVAASASAKALLTAPGSEGDVAKTFHDLYPEISRHLASALTGVRGSARYRKQRPGDDADWATIEFLVGDARVRWERHGASGDDAVKASRPSEALLIAPEIAAKVIDPRTPFAWTTFVADRPNTALRLETDVTLWRFLRASYCIDTESLANRLADGRYVFDAADREGADEGWMHIRCRFVEPADDPAWEARGTVDVWMDDSDGWVIRRSRLESKEPYMFDAICDAGPYITLRNGARIPKYLRITTYRTAAEGNSKALPNINGRSWSERVEFELIEAESAQIAESEFTLAALGVAPRHGFVRIWLIFVASAAAIAAAVLAIRRHRLRNLT